MLIDTPGLRSLGLPEDIDIEAAFPEIEKLAGECRFSDCSHQVEPGWKLDQKISRRRGLVTSLVF